MKKSLLVCAAVLGGLLATAARARADLLVWSEQWTASPHLLPATGPGMGGVSILTDPLPSLHLVGTSTLPVATFFSSSNDASAIPQTINNAPVSLTLTIHDMTDKETGTLTFTGELNGTLNAHQSNLALTWDTPSQNLHLDHYWYDVSLNPLNPGGVRDTGFLGMVFASVNVHHNPEPSSLVLAALGVPLFVLPGWRRWRRKQVGTSVA